ncbi:hypothetical protein NDU88_001480 [Pleurodeles waltl]|uniref:Uncharacterized protein n=1 Tax=Pleurodeles waltl TaxID=8319 RepID=A0AAV7RAH6_PLEWA|nr:hypothetical protein NDU88_001480 [Pleurodeles waltl]
MSHLHSVPPTAFYLTTGGPRAPSSSSGVHSAPVRANTASIPYCRHRVPTHCVVARTRRPLQPIHFTLSEAQQRTKPATPPQRQSMACHHSGMYSAVMPGQAAVPHHWMVPSPAGFITISGPGPGTPQLVDRHLGRLATPPPDYR